ncbi:MAG: hypothetical protein H7323_01855, partial [Frankiales bacterium]|nr:hypothetical protein [Frankiales bacterium]
MHPLPPALLALALVTACGSSPSTPVASGSDAASPSPAAAAAASRTPYAQRSPAPGAASAAPSARAPSSARAIPAAQGDVDGDGEPDQITYDGRTAVVALSGGGVVRASTAADIDPEDPVTS